MNKRTKAFFEALPERGKIQYSQVIAIDLNKIKRQSDGSIILNAGAFKVGDYPHLGYETPFRNVDFDEILIGRITKEEASKILDKFEGLCLLKNHHWVDDLAQRKELSVGTVLTNAKLETIEAEEIAMTRVVVADGDSIAKVESGEYNQLSIGFTYIAEDVRDKIDGVDFLIKDIELNHMALVKEGRAGDKARLYNHAKHKGLNMAKVKVDGKDYDVPQEVAEHISALGANSVEKSEFEKVKAENERLRGSYDALKQKAGENETVDKANEIAKSHFSLVADLQKLGISFDKNIGEYDRVEVMKDALTKAGYSIKADANADYVEAAFDVAKSQVKVESVVAGFTLPKTDASTAQSSYSEIEAAKEASKSHFFGKGE